MRDLFPAAAVLLLLCVVACGEEEEVVLGPEFQALGRVGPDGGRLCSGAFCLDFPNGALEQTVEVRARIASPGAAQQGVTIRGLVYELTASSTVFLKPVTLELPRPEGFYQQELRVLWREGDAGRWHFSYGEEVGGVIRAQTGHLSQWATAEVEGVWLGGIGLDSQGQVYAADMGGKRFVRMKDVTAASSSWEPLKTGGNLVKPMDAAVTPDGKILLADWGFAGVGLVEDLTGKGLKALYGGDNKADKIQLTHLVFAPSSGGLYAGHKIFDAAMVKDLTGQTVLRTGFAGGTLRGAAEAKGVVYLAASHVNGGDNNAIITDGTQGAKVYLGQQVSALDKIAELRGIAVDLLGQIYLGDRDKCAVTRLDDLQGKGERVIWNGGTCALQDLAMGPSSNLYIGTTDKVIKLQLDLCPNNSAKTEPGLCGCNRSDTDTDGDKTPDCKDLCPGDSAKTAPGLCGCGAAETDTDGDKTPDCKDLCPSDKNKTASGICGCGKADSDTDGDGLADCLDAYPTQGCSCFKLSALKAAKAATGAKCLKKDKLLFATATYDGVVEEYTNTSSYYAALLTGVQLDTAFGANDYYCGSGCYENPSGYGTKCVGKKNLVWTTLTSKIEYQACLDLITSACK